MDSRYRDDFRAWALEQADALERRAPGELDWDHLAEELATLGRSTQRELNSRLVILITHLLKWARQPERRGKSWRLTIQNQREALDQLLAENPSLKSVEAREFANAYRLARREAAIQTAFDEEDFPEGPPFTLEQCKDPEWWPA